MKRLTRDHLFRNYGDLSTLPAEPPLRVAPGEPFVVETVDTGHMFMESEADMEKPNGPMSGNPSTGPVYVEGIKAGDVIAVSITELHVVGHCKIGTGKETLLPPELVTERSDFVRIADGVAHFHGGLSAKVRPMFGCFGVVPAGKSPEPGHHGGNLDLPDIRAGSTVHVRCQRDGAYFCCGDGHAVQGDGEINGYSLEVSLEGTVAIERSAYQGVRTMMIETDDRFIAVGVEHSFADSIRSAEHSMAAFLAARKGLELLDAYQLSSHVGNIRVGPIWPAVRENRWEGGMPLPACVHLSKTYFG
jgi:amidase